MSSQKETELKQGKQINLLTASLKLTRTITRDDLKKGKVDFRDGTYLSDGHLVLCDSKNTRLMILDDNYRYVEEYSGLTLKPYGICSVHQGSEDVLYVVTGDYKLEVITYNKQGWTITRTLSTDTSVYGVACNGDTLITGQVDKVVVQSLTGKTKTKEWRKKGDHTYVVVSSQGDKFYHKDEYTVVCRGLDGTLYWEFQLEKLNYPTGICTDHQGNVYVVDNRSCNIHQISANGATHRIIVDPVQNMRPWGILFHPHKNMFIVTSNEHVTLQEYTFC